MDPTTLIRQQRDAAIALLAEKRLQLEASNDAIAKAVAAVAAARAAESQAILTQTEVEREVYALTQLIPKYDDLLGSVDVATQSQVDDVLASEQGRTNDKPVKAKRERLDKNSSRFKAEGVSSQRANMMVQVLIELREPVTLEGFTDICRIRMGCEDLARSQVGYFLNGLVDWGALTTQKIPGNRRKLYVVTDIVRLRRAHTEFDGVIKQLLQATMSFDAHEDIGRLVRMAAPLYVLQEPKDIDLRTLMIEDAAVFAHEFGLKVVRRGVVLEVVRTEFIEPSWQPLELIPG